MCLSLCLSLCLSARLLYMSSPKRRRSLTVSGVVSFYSLRRDNKVEDLEFHDEVLSLSSNPRHVICFNGLLSDSLAQTFTF